METPPPGQVVSPQGSSGSPQQQPPPPSPDPVLPQNNQQQPGSQSNETTQSFASPYTQSPEVLTQPPASQSDNEVISWTASEFIAHHKSSGWYVALMLAGAIFAAATYLLTSGDVLSIVVVVFVVLVFGFYGARKPHEQQYAISPDGVTIGPKTYQFNQFKSFSIIDEDAFSSITFMPMQRFMPAISIYYDPQDEDAIVEVLTAYLPVEIRGHDPIERFMRKIRF